MLNISNTIFNGSSDVVTSTSKSYVNDCTFNGASFLSNQQPRDGLSSSAVNPYTSVTNSHFNGTNNPKSALRINNSPVIRIVSNQINGYATGISLRSSGTTLSPQQVGKTSDVIYDNEIFDCVETGIELYNSVSDFKYNYLFKNGYGIRLFNNSYTAFNNYINSISTPQIIRDNESYELYASSNSFPSIFRWNQIIDEKVIGSSDDYFIYWEVKEFTNPLDVSNNYWGLNNLYPCKNLYPRDAFECGPIWDINDISFEHSLAESIYQTGLEYFANENYNAAETTFKELIENYPKSDFATAAMHELFAIKQFINQDFETLHTYYSSFTEADSTLFDVAQFLATRCNVMDKNWQPAIDWYENRIANPPSYPDSVFAIIDLGDIHLQMEADTVGMELKAKPFILSRFPDLIPRSRTAFEKNRSDLLATLPQKKTTQKEQPLVNGNTKGALQQNIPNPASESTKIVYELYIEGNVEIQIYNALGQQVQTIPVGIKNLGVFEVEISLKTIPTGLYEYALFVDGVRVDVRKMTVNK
jgi:tetratricopeptide (TPR) repeat protein